MNQMHLPATVKACRAAAGLTRPALSRLTGIPLRTLEDWEAGRRSPAPWVVELLAFRLRHLDIE